MPQQAKCFNTSILYTTNTLLQLLNKNWIYFFLLSLHHFLECQATGTNSSLIYMYIYITFFKFNMPRKMADKNYSIRIISSKLLSRLMLLRSILRLSVSLQFSAALLESSLGQSIFLSAYKAVNRFLIILLVTNQLGISFNLNKE